MADAEKDRLLKGLKEVASQGQETAKNAKQVAKDACFLSEIAKNLESVVKEIPDGSLVVRSTQARPDQRGGDSATRRLPSRNSPTEVSA